MNHFLNYQFQEIKFFFNPKDDNEEMFRLNPCGIKIGDLIVPTESIQKWIKNNIYKCIEIKSDNEGQCDYKWKSESPNLYTIYKVSVPNTLFYGKLIYFDKNKTFEEYIKSKDNTEVLCSKCFQVGEGFRWFNNYKDSTDETMLCLNCIKKACI